MCRFGQLQRRPGGDNSRIRPHSQFTFFRLSRNTYQTGSRVKKTIDIATDCGSLVVVNTDKEALARDIQIIRLIEQANAMFTFYSSEEAIWVERREAMLLKAKSLDFRIQESRRKASQQAAKKDLAHRRVYSQDLNKWPSNLVHPQLVVQTLGEWKL